MQQRTKARRHRFPKVPFLSSHLVCLKGYELSGGGDPFFRLPEPRSLEPGTLTPQLGRPALEPQQELVTRLSPVGRGSVIATAQTIGRPQKRAPPIGTENSEVSVPLRNPHGCVTEPLFFWGVRTKLWFCHHKLLSSWLTASSEEARKNHFSLL